MYLFDSSYYLDGKPSTIEPEWVSCYALAQQRGLDPKYAEKILKQIADELIEEQQTTYGDSAHDAKSLVAGRYIGVRIVKPNCPPTVAVSPLAIPLFESKIPPMMEGNWKNLTRLAQEHGGNESVWRRRILKLKQDLLSQNLRNCAPADFSEVKPRIEKEIDARYIGMRRTPGGGHPSLAISNEAERMLLTKTPPPMPDGWKTANMLRKEWNVDYDYVVSLMEEIQSTFIREHVEQKEMQEPEARIEVEKSLVGVRKRLSDGVVVLAASPEAQQRMAAHILPMLPHDWKTPRMLAVERGLSAFNHITRNVSELHKTLIEERVAKGQEIKSAQDDVETCLIGRRRVKRGGGAPLCVSPEAEAIMIERGLLRTVEPLGSHTARLAEKNSKVKRGSICDAPPL